MRSLELQNLVHRSIGDLLRTRVKIQDPGNQFVGSITSSTAQGGGGSFKNRKPIGEIGCCESGMAERIH